MDIKDRVDSIVRSITDRIRRGDLGLVSPKGPGTLDMGPNKSEQMVDSGMISLAFTPLQDVLDVMQHSSQQSPNITVSLRGEQRDLKSARQGSA